MAGDWIPFDHDLPDKEEVVAICTKTGATVADTLLRLCRLWIWFDRHTTDGIMKRIGNAGVTLRCGGDEAFWTAVCSVGWLSIDGDTVSIPHFEERFGASARRRLLTAKRVATHRAKRYTSVTPALPQRYPQPQPHKEERKAVSRPAPPPFSDLVSDWNSTPGVHQCVKTTAARQRAYKARCTDDGWLALIPAALQAVAASDFCRGKNDRGWTADIDWFLRPDTVVRLIEGKYGNGAAPTDPEPDYAN